MMSITQFRGKYKDGKAGLMFCLITKDASGKVIAEELRTAIRPNGTTTEVPVIYRAYRRPAGQFGPWTQFRYNGKLHAPSLANPIDVEKLPLGAKRMSDEESDDYWFAT